MGPLTVCGPGRAVQSVGNDASSLIKRFKMADLAGMLLQSVHDVTPSDLVQLIGIQLIQCDAVLVFYNLDPEICEKLCSTSIFIDYLGLLTH